MVTTMSDDNNPSSEQAPDGAGTTAQPPAPTDLVAAATAREQKALRQRQEVGQKLDAQLEENRKLRERLAALEQPKPKQAEPPAPDGAPEWFSAAMDPLTKRLAELEQMSAARSREGIVDSILAKVPDGNRSTAKTMIAGLEAQNQIDFSSPTAVADAIELLSSTSVMIDPDRGSLPAAPQVGTDGKLDFSRYKHPDEVPEGFLGQAVQDPETFKRLFAGTSGSTDRSDGYNI
jgi:hypothetical protein